jgi:6-phosphofructokinase 1
MDMMTKGQKEAGREVLLGGIAEYVCREASKLTNKESRSLVLGHLQRGGTPSTFDRLLGLRFGAAAVRTIQEGRCNVMVALDPPTVKAIPISEAIQTMKRVPLNCDTILTARSLGISFGD